MTVREKIEKALKRVRPEGEINAGDVRKCWEASTLRKGWHWVPFNGQPKYLGRNCNEALETVSLMDI